MGWTDNSAIVANPKRRKGFLQLKQIGSSRRSTPRSSVSENNSDFEPGMKRIGKSQIASGGYQDWD